MVRSCICGLTGHWLLMTCHVLCIRQTTGVPGYVWEGTTHTQSDLEVQMLSEKMPQIQRINAKSKWKMCLFICFSMLIDALRLYLYHPKHLGDLATLQVPPTRQHHSSSRLPAAQIPGLDLGVKSITIYGTCPWRQDPNKEVCRQTCWPTGALKTESLGQMQSWGIWGLFYYKDKTGDNKVSSYLCLFKSVTSLDIHAGEVRNSSLHVLVVCIQFLHQLDEVTNLEEEQGYPWAPVYFPEPHPHTQTFLLSRFSITVGDLDNLTLVFRLPGHSEKYTSRCVCSAQSHSFKAKRS